MNKLMMLISALVISFSAQAGNDGPQAVPHQEKNVVAEYVRNGGFFVPPRHPASYVYQILTDKTVVETIYFNGGASPKIRVLAKLNSQEWSRIITLVNQVKPGEIYDPNPSQPGCQDAGGSHYTVYNSHGKIQIYESYNCKQMKRENATIADTKIMQILNKYAAGK